MAETIATLIHNEFCNAKLRIFTIISDDSLKIACVRFIKVLYIS
jgi:hypothetical protein